MLKDASTDKDYARYTIKSFIFFIVIEQDTRHNKARKGDNYTQLANTQKTKQGLCIEMPCSKFNSQSRLNPS